MTATETRPACECGCGGPAPLARRTRPKLGHVKGQPVRFIPGHNVTRIGADHPRYNGGLSVSEGRTIVVLRDGSHQLYSRCLMEAHLKRHLTAGEIVHHVNEDPTDDRIENLELVTRAQHIDLHRDQLEAARKAKGYARGDDWRRARGMVA